MRHSQKRKTPTGPGCPTVAVFMMIQQQVFKKLRPSSVLPRNEEELQAKGSSLLTYLERYGGYRNQKEAGLCMWILAHAMDAAAANTFHADDLSGPMSVVPPAEPAWLLVAQLLPAL